MLVLSNYALCSILCRNMVTLRLKIMMLPPDSLQIIPLLYSIGTWLIKSFGRGGRLGTIRYPGYWRSNHCTEASWLEKKVSVQGNFRKKDRRLFHRALTKCHSRCLDGGRGGECARLHITEIRLWSDKATWGRIL